MPLDTAPSDIEDKIEALDQRLARSPLGWRIETGISFGDHPLQALDAIYPTSAPSPVPGVLMVHGGAWMGGRRDGSHYRLLLRQFAEAGFACFSTDYRLAPENRFPAQAEDVASAAAFLHENAGRFQIDPDRIAVLGSSAGGHLAALVALTGRRYGAPGIGGHPGPFAAAIGIATPTDFRADDQFSQAPDDPAAVALFGRPPCEIPEVAAEASPVTHADPSAPPFLLLHSRSDPRVDSRFSARLHAALENAGARSQLELFEGESHGLGAVHQQLFRKIVEFLSDSLMESQ